MALLSDYFSESDLQQITDSVRKAELSTSGEIRVRIRERYEPGVNNVDEQAECDFASEGLINTREKTGVLILVVLDARKLKILADEGIYRKLMSLDWEGFAGYLSAFFKDGEPAQGICRIVEMVGEDLAVHFPRRPDDINELPDDVIVRG